MCNRLFIVRNNVFELGSVLENGALNFQYIIKVDAR